MTTMPQPKIDWSRPAKPAPGWARELAASLGYPPGIPLERHITDERRHWIHGDTEEDLGSWKFDIIGIPIHSLFEGPDKPPDVFAYGYRAVHEGPLLWLRTIVIRCFLPNSNVFVERTYRADGAFREDICAVNTCEEDGIPFVRMMQDATKALELLGAVFPQSGPGRPLATGYIGSPEEFRGRIFPIIRELAAKGTKRPRQQQVCDIITDSWPEYQIIRPMQDSVCRPRQLRRWFTDHGWTDWKAVVDDALNAD